MKTVRTVLFTVAVLSLFAGLLGPAAAATSTGYVAYSIELNAHGVTHSAVVNESIAAGSGSSEPTLMLQVSSMAGNFSYSRALNTSMQLLPYLPTVTNQTFSYANNSSKVSVSLTQNGTVSLPFQGSTYKLTSFTFAVRSVSTNHTLNIDGSILTFPSGLVYSVKAGSNGTALQATLVSTSLTLTAASASGATQAASVGIGAGAAVSALALGLGVRGKLRPHQHKGEERTEDAPSSGEPKPDHWVD